MRVTIRPANLEDFERFGIDPPPFRVRAWCGEREDGHILGLGGIGYVPGTDARLVWFDLSPEAAKDYPVLLHRTATEIKKRLKGISKLVATTEDGNETFARWARRFGFEDTGVVVDGKRIWQCTSGLDTSTTTASTPRLPKAPSQPSLVYSVLSSPQQEP
jgi:hypothetical protein